MQSEIVTWARLFLTWDIWYKWAFPLRGTIGCHNQSSIRPNIYFQKHLYIFRQGFDWAPCGHAVDRCLDDLMFEVMLILEGYFTVSALNWPLLCQFGIVLYACTVVWLTKKLTLVLLEATVLYCVKYKHLIA